jgi:DNA-binding CsgD family transcriptional regulator
MGPIEFRVAPDGEVYFKEGKNSEKRLTRFEKAVCVHVLGLIHEKFPGAWSRLKLLYKPKSSSSAHKDQAAFAMVDRFIRCNFGEHDLLTPDIEHDIMNFEEVRCPLRGKYCPDEGVVCKPQSLIKLSPAEKEVAKLYLWGHTFDEIARQLGKSPQTVKVQLWRIKKKVGARNCREIIKVMRIHNI